MKPIIFQKDRVLRNSCYQRGEVEVRHAEPTESGTPLWLKPHESITMQDLMCFQTAALLGLTMKYFQFPTSRILLIGPEFQNLKTFIFLEVNR